MKRGFGIHWSQRTVLQFKMRGEGCATAIMTRINDNDDDCDWDDDNDCDDNDDDDEEEEEEGEEGKDGDNSGVQDTAS